MQRPRERQRIINLACGYSFACWTSVTVGWLLLLIQSPAAMLFGIMALIAGLVGLPHCLRTRRRKFVWVPAATLAYVALVIFIAVMVSGSRRSDAVTLMILCGVVYSGVLGPVVWSIAHRDFAKSVPGWLCAACGYTLLGLTGSTCPECGEPYDPSRVPDIAPGEEDRRGG